MKATKISNVLIALDYDETSQKVAVEGYAIAKAMNAEVLLVHVISEPPVYYSSYSYTREWRVDILGDLEESVRAFLERAKNGLGDASIKTMVKLGPISETILSTAEEKGVDLLVMGSHSRKWLENIFMGSHAQEVLKKTTLPLLIIPTKKQD